MNWWNLIYLFRPPWDTGQPPQALARLVESGELPPGRAIDLGCGTGTSVVYLAQHGFEVTGVDLAPRAIAKARRKACAAGVSASLLVGDVIHLPEVAGPFDLAIDIGCFHSLPPHWRSAYVKTLMHLLPVGGHYLLWCFLREGDHRPRFGPPGLKPGEVDQWFGWDFDIRTLRPPGGRPWTSTAYLLRRSKTEDQP